VGVENDKRAMKKVAIFPAFE